MFSEFLKNIRPFIGSLAAAVILLLAIIWGAGKGQQLAQAESVYQSSQQAQKAIQYFYQDQSRYPSVLEFSDQNTMLNYLSSYPLPELPAKNCPQSFDYKKVSDNSFQFSFCLEAAVSGYQAGWNTVSGVPSAGQR